MKPIRDSEPMVLFGVRIRTLRRQLNMTQQEVADRLQIDRTTYTKYEAGRVSPDQQGLVRLAEIFGCSVDSLLGVDNAAQEIKVANVTGAAVQLTEEEQVLLQMFRQLSSQERNELTDRIQKTFREQTE